MKPEPVIRMLAPVAPKPGEKPVIFGAPTDVVTVKLAELVPVPFGVVTAIGPLVAPLGAVALTLVSELNVNDADVPLNFTTDTPVKPVPVIETFVPTGPLAGLNELTVGGLPPPPPVTVKLVALVPVPFGVVTAIGPVAAPLGTVALRLVSELNVNDADVPLNFTTDTPVKGARDRDVRPHRTGRRVEGRDRRRGRRPATAVPEQASSRRSTTPAAGSSCGCR